MRVFHKRYSKAYYKDIFLIPFYSKTASRGTMIFELHYNHHKFLQFSKAIAELPLRRKQIVCAIHSPVQGVVCTDDLDWNVLNVCRAEQCQVGCTMHM